MPIARAPTRVVMVVVNLLARGGEEGSLGYHPNRDFVVHRFDPVRIERLALHRIEFGRGVIDELVDSIGLPAILVRPRRASWRAPTVPHGRRYRATAAICMPAGGQVELPAAVSGRSHSCSYNISANRRHIERPK